MQGGEAEVQFALQIFLPVCLSSYKQPTQKVVPGLPIDNAKHTFCTDSPLQPLAWIWTRALGK